MTPARRPTALLVLLAVALLLPALDAALPRQLRFGGDLVPVLYFALLGLGVNLVLGSAGLLNLGAAAFMAMGAFAFAILTCEIYPFQLGFWGGALGAILVSAVAGLLLGLPTLRLRGDYLAIVTLGFGEIAQDLLRNLPAITKGTKSINPLPTPGLGFAGWRYQFAPMAEGWLSWYWLYLALLVVAVVLLRNVERSRVGRALAAVREDELAARCMGVDVVRVKLAAFAGGSALCGLAGALMACSLGSSSEPGNYDFNLSVLGVCIVILGGMGSLPGVLLGALIMAGFNSIVLTKLDAAIKSLQGEQATSNVLLSPTNWKYLVFGLTLILMMRLRPEGVLPSRRLRAELREPPTAGGTGGKLLP